MKWNGGDFCWLTRICPNYIILYIIWWLKDAKHSTLGLIDWRLLGPNLPPPPFAKSNNKYPTESNTHIVRVFGLDSLSFRFVCMRANCWVTYYLLHSGQQSYRYSYCLANYNYRVKYSRSTAISTVCSKFNKWNCVCVGIRGLSNDNTQKHIQEIRKYLYFAPTLHRLSQMNWFRNWCVTFFL